MGSSGVPCRTLQWWKAGAALHRPAATSVAPGRAHTRPKRQGAAQYPQGMTEMESGAYPRHAIRAPRCARAQGGGFRHHGIILVTANANRKTSTAQEAVSRHGLQQMQRRMSGRLATGSGLDDDGSAGLDGVEIRPSHGSGTAMQPLSSGRCTLRSQAVALAVDMIMLPGFTPQLVGALDVVQIRS